MVNFFRRFTDYVSHQLSIPDFKNRNNNRQSTIDDIVGTLTAAATSVTAAVASTGIMAYAAYSAAVSVGAIGAAAVTAVAMPVAAAVTIAAAPYVFNRDYRANFNHFIGQLVTNSVETGVSLLRTGAGLIQDVTETAYLGATWTVRQAATGLLHGAEYLADAFSGNGQIPGYNAHVGNTFRQNWNSINAEYNRQFDEINTRMTSRFINDPYTAGHGNNPNSPTGLANNIHDLTSNFRRNAGMTFTSYIDSFLNPIRNWFSQHLYNPGQRLAFS